MVKKILASLGMILITSSCGRIEKLNDIPITIEANYMQYACGDWNDDMKINKVNDTSYSFLIGKDIDPLFLNGENIINEWFYANKTKEYGMEFRLQGYISSCAESGCENGSPKFWIIKMEHLSGEVIDLAKNSK